MPYSIGQAAKRMGVASSTLRYYDKEGLLPNVKRSQGGARIFEEDDFRWLSLIDCMKKSGMSIEEIKEYLALMKEGDKTIEQRLALFERRKRLLQEEMKSLKETKEYLEYKVWYYRMAKEIGSVEGVPKTPLDLVPKRFRKRFAASFLRKK
jgi:DNA-binding transcriptional MerR regulator